MEGKKIQKVQKPVMLQSNNKYLIKIKQHLCCFYTSVSVDSFHLVKIINE